MAMLLSILTLFPSSCIVPRQPGTCQITSRELVPQDLPEEIGKLLRSRPGVATQTRNAIDMRGESGAFPKNQSRRVRPVVPGAVPWTVRCIFGATGRTLPLLAAFKSTSTITLMVSELCLRLAQTR
jgi:hypothetical protein